jgi:hypothetical protein
LFKIHLPIKFFLNSRNEVSVEDTLNFRFVTDEKNVSSLFVLISANVTGVKFPVDISTDEKQKSIIGTFPVFDVDKSTPLFEPVSMCK